MKNLGPYNIDEQVSVIDKNIARAEADVERAENMIKFLPAADKEDLKKVRDALVKWKKFLSDTSHITVLRSQYIFPCEIEKVNDADTITVTIDQGFNDIKTKQKMRLWGINAPENRTDKGKAATKLVEELLPAGTKCLVESIESQTGKYGRWLAIIWAPIPNDETTFPLLLHDIPTMSVDSPDPTHFNLNEWLVRIQAAEKNLYVR